MSKKIAVVLFQLGGPDSLEAVQPFLFNLFMDPDIIDFPLAWMARKPLAKFISSRRKDIAAQHYKEIGGKSPILELTNAQAKALQSALDGKIDAKVFVAMRYWHPLTEIAVNQIKAGNFDEVILLPLYPHCSITTSGSSINEWNRQCARAGLNVSPQKLVHQFYNNLLYIEAIVDNINKALAKFSGVDPKSIQLVFSAHGVPLYIIERGDPYQRHIEATVRLVMERGKWNHPHLLCYQSKVGPAKWLAPSLNDTVHSLATNGVKNMLIIPIAFVTDHIETLHEINIETREEATKLGVERFEMMPALNDHPKFIQALRDEVLKQANDGNTGDARMCQCRAKLKLNH
ncbi:MAG: ferrochelatase [Ignavibacteriales bacterium]|nr:ferrochelatase [Ignavibacteriales bacterium]